MDLERKRALLEAYKHRKPEMGVISLRCRATGEEFVGISNDTKADFNSVKFKLMTGTHPNLALRALWKEHGEAGFDAAVVAVLKYDDPAEDHTEELEELREAYFAAHPDARRIWK